MAEDRIGQRLGNYRLIRHLGEGGFADVYLGTHLYLKTQAAIKVLQTRLADDDRGRFLNEARTIARLKHPHIVRVLDFGVEHGLPFLVMEYAPHGTLRQRHRKGTRLDAEVIVSYLTPIADALYQAHEHKLIHRDVKPENILIGEQGEVMLSDFGIAVVAHSTHSSTPAREIAGTVVYMAPEQVQGKPCPASDQYALGIMAYEWLTGTRPFEGSFIEIATQQVLAPPPPLHERVADIPPALEAVVLQALAKDSKERFASVLAFAQAFAHASLASRSSANTTPALKTARTTPRRAEEASPTMILPPRFPRHLRPRLPHPRPLRGRAILATLLLLVLLGSGIGVFLATRPQAAPAAMQQSILPPTPTLSTPLPTPTPTPPPYPVILAVSAFRPVQHQTITISGTAFGSQAAYTNADSRYLRIEDVTAGAWQAGYEAGAQGVPNFVKVSVSLWSDRQIVITDFTGPYGVNGGKVCNYCVLQFNTGDTVIISVWNPQTQAGPAQFTLIVTA